MRFTIICFSGIIERGKKKIFSLKNYIPAIRDRVKKELDEIDATFANDALQRMKDVPFIVRLPNNGLESDQVLERVKQYVQLGT